MASPAFISNQDFLNSKPVVTFDNSAGHMYIGWTFENLNDPSGYVSSLGACNATYPIVLVRDQKGEDSQCLKYWEVPELTCGVYEIMNALSVSGRYVSDNLYTWYNDGSQNGSVYDIFYKSVAQSTTPALRTEPAAKNFDISPVIYPNPAGDILNIKGAAANSTFSLYNLFGEETLKMTLKEGVTQVNISALSAGIYLVKVNSPAKMNQWLLKFIKM